MTKWIRRNMELLLWIAIAPAFLGCLLAVGVVQVPADQGKLFKTGASQTFRMLNPDNLDSGGTGFAVVTPAGNRYTMTNAHVCNISKKGYLVAERNGMLAQVQILSISPKTDLCITTPVPNYKGLELAEEVGLYDGVYVVGHPRLQPISVSAGWVRVRDTFAIGYCRSHRALLARPILRLEDDEDGERFIPDCIKMVDSYMTNNDSQPGNSGSAVLNDSGKVVGVLFAGDGNGTSLIVPLDHVREFLLPY